jgi:hypothetical protein
MAREQEIAGRRIVPARKVEGRVAATLAARGRDFVSLPVDALKLDFDGIEGDFHAGSTRKSGGREPWYERGTLMRNERQLSIVSTEEMAQIASNLGVLAVEAGWIGANLVLEGIPDMTLLPPRTLLVFEGGVTLRVDGFNAPCRLAGGSIARHLGAARTGGPLSGDAGGTGKVEWNRTDMALAFVQAAWMRRGLVAWVEKPGEIRAGEAVTARIWEQWIY